MVPLRTMQTPIRRFTTSCTKSVVVVSETIYAYIVVCVLCTHQACTRGRRAGRTRGILRLGAGTLIGAVSGVRRNAAHARVGMCRYKRVMPDRPSATRTRESSASSYRRHRALLRMINTRRPWNVRGAYGRTILHAHARTHTHTHVSAVSTMWRIVSIRNVWGGGGGNGTLPSASIPRGRCGSNPSDGFIVKSKTRFHPISR